MTERDIFSNDDLDAFEDFLARFGSDKARWPAQDRLAAAGLVARNASAARMLREAEALDRLLSRAPASRTDIAQLAHRITAEAFAETPKPSLVWQPAVARGMAAAAVAPAPARFNWRSTAAVMAASLMLGAYLGFSGDLVQKVAPGLTQTASQSASDSDDPAQLALGEDAAGLLEDLL